MSKAKGGRTERELFHILWDNGFSVVRSAGSGSTTKVGVKGDVTGNLNTLGISAGDKCSDYGISPCTQTNFKNPLNSWSMDGSLLDPDGVLDIHDALRIYFHTYAPSDIPRD